MLSGTSQAAPHVAGLSALVLSHYPAFNSEEVRQVLRTTSDDLGEAGWDMLFGHGQINALHALEIGHEPCLALITDPQHQALVDGVVSVEGLADGVDFASYELFVKDLDGVSWQQIGDTVYSPVAYGELLAWDTMPFIDGNYLLKLVVADTFNEVYTDYCSVIVDRTYITSPEPDDVLRIGGVIDIIGTVKWPAFSSYYLEYEYEQNPGLWYTDGVQLANGGLQEVHDDLIAQLDTGQMTIQQAGRYRIRIVVNGSEAEVVPVYMDPTLKQGWPQKLPVGYAAYFMMQLAAADLTAEDGLEIVMNYPVHSRGAFAFSGNGSYLDGWPVAPDGSIYFSTPAIGDIDDDGSKDVVFAVSFPDGVYLYALSSDGTVKNSWSLAGDALNMNSVVVADINLDAKAEIIVLSKSSGAAIVYLEVFDHAGNYLGAGWPVSIPYSLAQTCFYNRLPAVGNLDGDREFEIVYANGLYLSGEEVPWKTEIYVLNGDGTMVEGWPQIYDHNSQIASPVVGDLDSDGTAEIVFLTDVYLYALDNMGGVLWTVGGSYGGGSPALADFDGDGYLKVVYNRSAVRRTSIVDYQGNAVRHLLHDDLVEYYSTNFPLGSSAIGDVDGDDIPDIVVAVKDKVIAWNFEGDVLDGFPKQIAKSEFSTPLLGDIDGDGNVDLMACANDYADRQRAVIYAWNVGGAYDEENVEWPQFQYDCGRSGCYGCFICPRRAQWGDADCDGDVDQDDFNAFQACSSGPAIPLSAGCEEKDFDTDNDVDQDDFSIFQRCYSGQNNPADPYCAN
ncbi:MAG: VCBS repeat-containing protein [Planctomycetota bacterium]|nr:MAG: VCBS repeat-containing protein [Planctomycetota bacterium]